jgi:IS1 family transposase
MTLFDDPRSMGDMWTFVAIDAETKVVPSHLVGKRTSANARAFIGDLSERLTNRVQISSDALRAYVGAIEQGFGRDVDYGQIVKFYEAEPVGAGRYSPPKVIGSDRTAVIGRPDPVHISTSFVERQNLTMRMSMRRFTRLTNAFSKKVDNLRAAVALHFAWYNFVRIHRTLRCTPAMAAGLSNHVWELGELIAEISN